MADIHIDRRGFVAAGAAAGLGYFFTGPAASVAKTYRANETLRVAGIGVGGKGSSDIDQAGSFMDVVALCDCDAERLAPKAKKWDQAKTFSDYRKLFDECGKEIDAAVISTPDHHHAPAAARAITMGKHVYVQKPLTHTIFEARQLRELAKKHNVCSQMGNQGTASDGLRRAVEFLRSGGIGDIQEIHVWTNRPKNYWIQAPTVMKPLDPTGDTPDGLDWESFIGPAPMRKYTPGYHPFAWRGWLDFGTGALGDMACHTANMAFMGAELKYPTSVIADATDVNPYTYPSSAHVIWEFPKRGDKPALTMHWYEGKKNDEKLLPPDNLLEKATKNKLNVSNSGSLLVGTKGMLYSPNDYGGEVYFITDDGAKKLTGGPEKLPSNNGGDKGMKKEWHDAIVAGKPSIALSNFDYSGVLTETVLLGNVAIKLTGTKLDWNGEALNFPNNAEATALVTKSYRDGWELMGQGQS